MSQVVNNLRAAFQKLTSDVDRALLTRVGNQEQLSIVRNEVLRFYEAAEIVKFFLGLRFSCSLTIRLVEQGGLFCSRVVHNLPSHQGHGRLPRRRSVG